MTDATKPDTTVADPAQSAPTAPAPTPPTDDLVTTEHTFKMGRRSLRYAATTGRMVISPEKSEGDTFHGATAAAQLSLTSYVALEADPASRPVMFAFNGGPGSSSVWLHLGLLGPQRVDAGDAGHLTAPPFGLIDNAESLLAVTDLVFIDPVSTGWSRTVPGGTPKDFHGFQPDIDSVGELIRLWVTRNNRWLSPKFLIGESYGTVRASALAEHLQSAYAMYLNGVALISSIIDFNTADDDFRNDRAHVGFLPTFAAAAHYHGKHGRKSLKTVLAEAEAFCERDYPWALARGNRLTAAQRETTVQRLAELTGLSPAYVDRANLRINHIRFFTELLRDRGQSTGRLDARFTGPLADGNAAEWDADPSMDAINGAYAAAFNHHVRTNLGYESDLAYAVTAPVYKTWSYKEFEAKPIDVTAKLARAMRANPHLQVHVAYGYHDGATPYYAAQDAFAHLDLPPALAANIEHCYYEAGHMMYVHEPSRIQQSKDLAAFVTRASNR